MYLHIEFFKEHKRCISRLAIITSPVVLALTTTCAYRGVSAFRRFYTFIFTTDFNKNNYISHTFAGTGSAVWSLLFNSNPHFKLRVKVVWWQNSNSQSPPGLTITDKDPKGHQREVSSEVELHCVGSLWGPAVRNKPFCTITRSMSQSQSDGGDQRLDF